MSASSRTPDDPNPRQQPLDFARGEQLAILRDCELPNHAKDKYGKGVKAMALKLVLLAIDQFGRGRSCYPSIDAIARTANVGRRTAIRALEVLVQLGVLCVEQDAHRHGRYGSPTNTYALVWSELKVRYVNRGLFRPPSLFPDANHSATGGTVVAQNQSATGADQSATGADQSATGADQSATGGIQTAGETVLSAYEPPPPTPKLPAASSVATWAAAADFFRGRIGIIDELVAVARTRQQTPGQFVAEVQEVLDTALLAANASKFTKGPINAAVWRLRNGTWPAEQVLSLADHRRREADRRSAQRAAAGAETERLAAADRRAEAEREREARLGPRLDALTHDELLGLSARLGEFEATYVRRSLRELPASGIARGFLLSALEAEALEADELAAAESITGGGLLATRALPTPSEGVCDGPKT